MDKYSQLFESIFKKEIGSQDAIEALEKTTADFPYFIPAHFFLLNLTGKESINYIDRAKKTSALFNNNYWLNFQLQVLSSHNKIVIDDAQSLTSFNTETQIIEENEIGIEPIKAADTAALEPAATNVELGPESEITVSTAKEQEFGFTNSISVVENVDRIEMVEKPSVEIIKETESDISFAPSEISAALTSIQEAEKPLSDERTHMESATETIDLPADKPLQNLLTETNLTQQVEMVPIDENAAENLVAEEPLPPILINISKEPVTEDRISFEPLHTSDYFASVGIKLSEEVKPADRLGQQLKSFTEWLKTMKKIHAEQFAATGTAPESAEQTNEQNIQQLAEASNKEGETVTEAMADVLIQQGRVGKAIAVLEKLSLLNPGKITYFAAKINQLKEQ